MTEEVAFVGLGAMGGPIAGHLAAAGHTVTVYNRTSATADAWVSEYGGTAAATLQEAAKSARFVFSCVGGDDDLRAITTGEDGVFRVMQTGAVYVDHTTTSAEVAQQVGEQAKADGFSFLDAPLAGGVSGAQRGVLSIMVGGDAGAFERAAPLMETYGQSVLHLGQSGAGQLTKMVNQICVTGIIESLAEGLSFAQRAGLDGEKVIEAISNGSAASWQIGNRAAAMLRRDFSAGGTVELLRKDLDICLKEAARIGGSLPVVNLVQSFYEQIIERGDGKLDAASLISLLNGTASPDP
jgi:3-hydroxyisobutyrate dehydrogenase-like beta-hydroxyacid dehydrogenase